MTTVFEMSNECAEQPIERRTGCTVSENIDNKIRQLQAEIARLETSKNTLGILLHMRIRDIREAMNY